MREIAHPQKTFDSYGIVASMYRKEFGSIRFFGPPCVELYDQTMAHGEDAE